MERQSEYIKHGYSDNPVYDEIMWKLSELAGHWRTDKEEQIVRRYQAVLLCLLELGWDDELDIELELPDELMPPEYFQRYEEQAEPLS